MRTFINGAMSLLMALGVMLTLATAVSANPVAGGGYDSSYAGESIFTNNAAGETGQMSAIFFNSGTVAWAPGVIGLLVCAADKLTCNVPSNNNYAHNWFSQTVYATVTAVVGPGQNGFFIYDFTVPAGTPAGVQTSFYGDLGLIATGAELRPEGYFQINTTPLPSLSLTLSPSSASVPVGGTQQFVVNGAAAGQLANWNVTGGCGAITATGLFAATAMNSASQPCSVVANIGSSNASAPVTVFGPATQIGCTATPSSIIANGGGPNGTAVAKLSLKDANGNTVTNASTPQINVNNNTPLLAFMSPTGLITPTSGVATVSVVSTLTSGDIQLSASGTGLTGCSLVITSGGPGAAARTSTTFLTNPIAADNLSTSTLRIDVTDVNGNRVISDNTTVLTVTRDANSANVCNITAGPGSFAGGSGSATASQGRVQYTVTATSQPGQCLMTTTTNNQSISGSSGTLTTQIVGSANKLAVLSNDSPHPAANTGSCTVAGPNTDASCTTIVVGVQDVNGSLVTSDNGRSINANFDTNNCTSSGGGPATVRALTATANGKATFVISSAGAYSNCTVTFSSSNVSSVNASVVWTTGGADHLACTFSPAAIVNDGASTSQGTVSVKDSFGNTVTTGTFSVNFGRSGGIGAVGTTQITASPQTTGNGNAFFTVRSNSGAVGTDTYTPSLSSGTLAGTTTTCFVEVKVSLP